MADKFKFALAILLLVAGIAGFYLLAEQAMILRVLAVMAGTGLAAGVAWKTEPGQRFFGFARESAAEASRRPRRRRSSGRPARRRCRRPAWFSPSSW
ncbi:MAG: preprotein translocase subunit SecE [Candidatus Accumulibacter sp. BA-94]|nr:MAG: preprotein translocase subunit SecE [Candidatus Accumulibacter sp. BA-94]